MDDICPHFIVYNAAELRDNRTVIVSIPNYHAVAIGQPRFGDVESVFGGYIGDS